MFFGGLNGNSFKKKMDPGFLMTLTFGTPTDQQIADHDLILQYPIDPEIQKIWDTMVIGEKENG